MALRTPRLRPQRPAFVAGIHSGSWEAATCSPISRAAWHRRAQRPRLEADRRGARLLGNRCGEHAALRSRPVQELPGGGCVPGGFAAFGLSWRVAAKPAPLLAAAMDLTFSREPGQESGPVALTPEIRRQTTGSGTCVLELVGEHDLATVEKLRAELGEALASSSGVVVDLTETTFIDPLGHPCPVRRP